MAKTNAELQQAWRDRNKAKRELTAWRKRILAQWQEHNRLIVTRQPDGGYRIQVEQSPEGERITAEVALLCGESPDRFLEMIVAEVLADMQGRFVPASEQKELREGKGNG